MRILLILVVLIASCKKKDTTPTPVVEPCKTVDVFFTGKYYRTGTTDNDTIIFVFQNNNCPTKGSNTYLVKNFGFVANRYLGQSGFSTADNYTVSTKEADRTATGVNSSFFLNDDPSKLTTSLTVTLSYGSGGKIMHMVRAK
jgi:hypothetical protein